MFNPLFEQHPTAAAHVGWMLTAYGELEYQLAEWLGHAIGDKDDGVLVYFKLISETARLNTALGLIRKQVRAMELADQFSVVVGAMRFCLRARNTYAHSHWANDKRLWFLNMQDATEGDVITYQWRHTNIRLLRQQKEFFAHTSACISYLSEITRHRAEGRENQNKRPSHVLWPAHRPVPPLETEPKKPLPGWIEQAPAAPVELPSPKRPRGLTREGKASRKLLWKKRK